MRRALHAETRAILYNRPVVLIVAGAIAFATLSAIFGAATRLTDLLHAEVVTMTLLLLLAGATAGAADYQHGTVHWTLLGTPDRAVAARAKLVAATAAGVLSAAVILAVTWGGALAAHGSVSVGTSVLGLVAGQFLLGGLSASFGTACGMALRSLPGAVAAAFTAALAVPIAFHVLGGLSSLSRLLPFGEFSSGALALGSAPASFGPQLPLLAAAVVMVGWTAALWCAATAGMRDLDL